MIHRYPVHLTTLEEDFRAIGLLPGREISEMDDATEPRDIPSPDPSTLHGLDDSEETGGARHKYAKQPRPKMAPDDSDDHDDPLDAGATQHGAKRAGSYKPVAYGKEASLESVGYPDGYTTLKGKLLDRVKMLTPTGPEPKIAQGLAPATDTGLGTPKRMESANVSRAAELVGEVEALIAGSQMDEDTNNLSHGFYLIAENCSLLADRLIDIAESYNVDSAIEMIENVYHNAVEAHSIIESSDEELDLASLKEAFRIMTLALMDAVEAYDGTISEMSEDDDEDDDEDEHGHGDHDHGDEHDDDDDDEHDDDDDDEHDDDDDQEEGKHLGGMAAKMAMLRAMKKMGK